MDNQKLCLWLPNLIWNMAQDLGKPASKDNVPTWNWHDLQDRIADVGGQKVRILEMVTVAPDDPGTGRLSHRAFRVADRTLKQGARQILEQFFEADTHDQAMQILRHASSSKTGFGLYLRGYHLSAMVGVGLAGNYATAGKEETATSTLTDDRDVQKALGALRFVLPVVGLRNPYDPMPNGEMPKLALPLGDWEDTTRQLILAATAIIVVVDRSSPGLMSELRMIAQCGCGGRTVLIRYGKDTTVNAALLTEMTAAQPREMSDAEAAEWNALLAEFDTPLEYPGAAFETTARDLVEKLIVEQSSKRIMMPPIELPPRPGPPREDAEAAGKLGRELTTASARHAAAGRFYAAEDVAYACLSLGYLANDERLRAISHLELARIVGLGLGESDEAVKLYDRAYWLYSRLGVADMAITCRQEQAVMLCELKRYAEARTCLQGLASVWLGKLGDWAKFCVWNTLHEVELASGDQAATREAWREGLVSYQAYRNGGGLPRRPGTLAVAQFTGMMKAWASVGIHHLDSDSPVKQAAADDVKNSAVKHMRPGLLDTIGKWLVREVSSDELLASTKGVDEYYEVSLMMYTLSGGQ